jgi:hypothetical protein
MTPVKIKFLFSGDPQAIDHYYGVDCEVCSPSGSFWLIFGALLSASLIFSERRTFRSTEFLYAYFYNA